jgi:hypothetical protein
MEELQAKWTFDQGGFAKALIVPTPMGQGYQGLYAGTPENSVD